MPFVYAKPREGTWRLVSLQAFRFSPLLNHSTSFCLRHFLPQPASQKSSPCSHHMKYCNILFSGVINQTQSCPAPIHRSALSSLLQHIHPLLGPTWNWNSIFPFKDFPISVYLSIYTKRLAPSASQPLFVSGRCPLLKRLTGAAIKQKQKHFALLFQGCTIPFAMVHRRELWPKLPPCLLPALWTFL